MGHNFNRALSDRDHRYLKDLRNIRSVCVHNGGVPDAQFCKNCPQGRVKAGQALNLDYGHWGKPEQMRVGHIMNRLGWRRKRLSASGKSDIRPWGYEKPKTWRRHAQPVQKESAF